MRASDGTIHFFFQPLSEGVNDARDAGAFLSVRKHSHPHDIQRLDSLVVRIIQIVLLQYIQNDLVSAKPNVSVLVFAALRTLFRNINKLVQVLQIGIEGKAARIEEVLVGILLEACYVILRSRQVYQRIAHSERGNYCGVETRLFVVGSEGGRIQQTPK